MKKLWTASVSVDFQMAIWAESEAEAMRVAKENATEEHDNLDPRWDICVSGMAPPRYLDDSYAYGDDEQRLTVGEIKAMAKKGGA